MSVSVHYRTVPHGKAREDVALSFLLWSSMLFFLQDIEEEKQVMMMMMMMMVVLCVVCV